MGCSYDPHPQSYWPTPADQWMEDNGFSSVGNIASVMGGGIGAVSYCHECGTLIFGGKAGRRFLTAHLGVCTIKPREEIPEKTEEELKTDKYKKMRYV